MRRLWPIAASHRHDQANNFAASFQTRPIKCARDKMRKQRVARNDDIGTGNEHAHQVPSPIKKKSFQLQQL